MKDWRYDFSEEKKIAENEHFVAYEVRSTVRQAENVDCDPDTELAGSVHNGQAAREESTRSTRLSKQSDV